MDVTYIKLSHVSYFLDIDEVAEEDDEADEEGYEQVSQTGEEADDVEWETIQASDIEEMPEEKASSPAPRTPGKTPPKKPSKLESPGVASIQKGIGTMGLLAAAAALGSASRYTLHNFNHRYMCTAPSMAFLQGGERMVLIDYLVHSTIVEDFRVEVSDDDMSLKLQSKVPKAFLDLTSRANAEFDQRYENARVILSRFRSAVDIIVRCYGPDFDSIWSTGQVDSLPFPCLGLGNPHCQIFWHEAEQALKNRMWDNLKIAGDAKHQMMPLLGVTLVSRERMRKSAVRVADAVVLRLSQGSAFDNVDCAPPPPPPAPFALPAGDQRRVNYGGGRGGGGGAAFAAAFASGAYSGNLPVTTTSLHSIMSRSFDAAVNDQTIRDSNNRASRINKNGDKNDSPRKRKSPRADKDGNANVAANVNGIILVEEFYNGMKTL